MVRNPVFHSRTKHIALKTLFHSLSNWVVFMESTGLASFTNSNKLVKKKRRKYNQPALMILLSSSLCYVIKWLALLDVKIFVLRNCLSNTTISLLVLRATFHYWGKRWGKLLPWSFLVDEINMHNWRIVITTES
jgi:hypothetical protein